MTYEVLFEHDPPIEGRRVCLTNIGGVFSQEEAKAEARKRWPGIVRFKWVHLQVKVRKKRKTKTLNPRKGRPIENPPVELPPDLTDRILARSRKRGG